MGHILNVSGAESKLEKQVWQDAEYGAAETNGDASGLTESQIIAKEGPCAVHLILRSNSLLRKIAVVVTNFGNEVGFNAGRP